MKKGIFGILSFVLISAFVLNCGGTSNPFLDKAKEDLGNKDYEAALVATDSLLEQNPNSAVAYYYKGRVYNERATNNPDVAARKDDYAKAYESLTKAIELNEAAEEKAGEVDTAPVLIGSSWSQEHNAAIDIATNELTQMDPTALGTAADHLINAITVNPDSVVSYEIIAEVYRRLENFEEGSKYLQMAVDKKNPASAFDYDRLAVFYSISQQPAKAVNVLEQGLELYPDSVSLVQKLADAYMGSGNTDGAIRVLYQLIENDPENGQYRLVIGTQLYQSALSMRETIDANVVVIDSLKQSEGSLSDDAKAAAQAEVQELEAANAELDTKATDFTGRSEKELIKTTELMPTSPIAFNTLGIIYQNKAAALFDARNNENDLDKADEFDAAAKAELEIAANYYEQAVALVPEDKQQPYWETLFRVYTTLDWVEKRDAAMEKAGY